MIIAGEPSGDLLGSELASALHEQFARAKLVPSPDYQPLHTSLAPIFFGAGGPAMARAGVKISLEMTNHSVVGLTGVLRAYPKFRRFFKLLYRLALEREPDVIICVDFSGFNRRFAHAIKAHVRSRLGPFNDWNPKIVQYVSPQVWASRESRAYQMAKDFDLLLSIIPFEKDWYAARVPKLRVEFVGHPVLDRYRNCGTNLSTQPELPACPKILLLPGSRESELFNHLPVMLGALSIIQSRIQNLRALMVLPNQRTMEQAKGFALPATLTVQIGNLAEVLANSTIAIASTGTVTSECAYFGVPTVALYKSSWFNYQIGKRIITVKYLALPNLLANEEIFPEFIQQNANSENIAGAALDLLQNENRRQAVKSKLSDVVKLLGAPGTNERAARAILQLLETDQA